jgi:hypothetical protein
VTQHAYPPAGPGPHPYAPWTVSGPPDPEFDATTRAAHHALLTDPDLLACYRRRFPARAGATYDEMVRALGYVWDCPHDGAANVTGHRCARCARTLSEANG